jgi:hypothetical protein
MRYIMIIALFCAIISCKSNDKPAADKKLNESGVQNVNGTLPDTSNSINLSTQKKDTGGNKK